METKFEDLTGKLFSHFTWGNETAKILRSPLDHFFLFFSETSFP